MRSHMVAADGGDRTMVMVHEDVEGGRGRKMNLKMQMKRTSHTGLLGRLMVAASGSLGATLDCEKFPMRSNWVGTIAPFNTELVT